jgi:hypothetical protein
VTACARRDLPDPSIFFFFRDSSVSMAFIGPNFFCVRSIFTSFSARHSGWSPPREFFSFHLLSLRAMRNCPPLCLTSHVPRGPFPFHFVTILFLLRWRSYAIRCRWGHDACYASSDGTCDETGWPMRGKKEREVAAGTRIPSHGVLVLPASESARKRLVSMLSLCSLSRSWSPRRGSPGCNGGTERVRVGVLESSRVCSV